MIGYIQTPEMINLFAHSPVTNHQACKLNDMYTIPVKNMCLCEKRISGVLTCIFHSNKKARHVNIKNLHA